MPSGIESKLVIHFMFYCLLDKAFTCSSAPMHMSDDDEFEKANYGANSL